MQGIHEFIPTDKKISYINALLRVGFDTVDAGSFVSAKAIPQMRDTKEVLKSLDMQDAKSKILVIVGNVRGAAEAAAFDEVTCIGFPFSISETFQRRNTNSGIKESLGRTLEMLEICAGKNKELVVYISMAFGNPYGEEWSADIAASWVDTLVKSGVKTISLADTIGSSTPESIEYLFGSILPSYPGVEFGAHLHTRPGEWKEKMESAWKAGCRRFDGAVKGFGGCPMATDKLTGNMPTEKMLEFFGGKNVKLREDEDSFRLALDLAIRTFPAELPQV